MKNEIIFLEAEDVDREPSNYDKYKEQYEECYTGLDYEEVTVEDTKECLEIMNGYVEDMANVQKTNVNIFIIIIVAVIIYVCIRIEKK